MQKVPHPSEAQSNTVNQFDCCSRGNSECKCISFLVHISVQMHSLALKGTELANAYVGTLRLKLLKIGAVILRNTRRVLFLLSSAYPHQRLFLQVTARLAPV